MATTNIDMNSVSSVLYNGNTVNEVYLCNTSTTCCERIWPRYTPFDVCVRVTLPNYTKLEEWQDESSWSYSTGATNTKTLCGFTVTVNQLESCSNCWKHCATLTIGSSVPVMVYDCLCFETINLTGKADDVSYCFMNHAVVGGSAAVFFTDGVGYSDVDMHLCYCSKLGHSGGLLTTGTYNTVTSCCLATGSRYSHCGWTICSSCTRGLSGLYSIGCAIRSSGSLGVRCADTLHTVLRNLQISCNYLIIPKSCNGKACDCCYYMTPGCLYHIVRDIQGNLSRTII